VTGRTQIFLDIYSMAGEDRPSVCGVYKGQKKSRHSSPIRLRISLPRISPVKPPTYRNPPRNLAPMQLGVADPKEFLPALPNELVVDKIWPLFFFDCDDRLRAVRQMLHMRLVSKFWLRFVDDTQEMLDHQMFLFRRRTMECYYRDRVGRFRHWGRRFDLLR
jgi:hypothetical protein